MKYISTRGRAKPLSFAEVVMAGVASDGGLYVPEQLPSFTTKELSEMSGMSYIDLAFAIIRKFKDDSINDDDLYAIIETAYNNFTHKDITPLRKISANEYLLELFHGPTLSFKDCALQFLGGLFDYYLNKLKRKVIVIGATSGDTGSAAIEGCYRSNWIDLFILHPHDRISPVQRKQMASVISDNVHNLAVKTDFDGCQNIVKTLFNDQGFLENKTSFVAINSINWCRIMAQIVYYFYAWFKLPQPIIGDLIFSVPTGNFGDVFAGYLAKNMGLPIKKLVIATNANDILDRFIKNNDYSRHGLIATSSPSMDIQVASNFERLLFDVYDRDSEKLSEIMKGLGSAITSVSEDKLIKIRETFASDSASDDIIFKTISQIYSSSGLIIDPHTATAVYAARNNNLVENNTVIELATAHPAKFPEGLLKAGVPSVALPYQIDDLMSKDEKYQIIDPDIKTIKGYIIEARKSN